VVYFKFYWIITSRLLPSPPIPLLITNTFPLAIPLTITLKAAPLPTNQLLLALPRINHNKGVDIIWVLAFPPQVFAEHILPEAEFVRQPVPVIVGGGGCLRGAGVVP
jgi:hypothetical protein